MLMIKYLLVPLVFICLLFACEQKMPVDDKSLGVKKYYLSSLREADSNINIFHNSIEKRAPLSLLRTLFRKAKCAYKKTEFLTEYTHPEIAKLLNGPAVPEVEVEDNLNTIVPPEGFQVIEGLLFEKDDSLDWKQLDDETAKLAESTRNTERIVAATELSDSLIFKALRKEVFRITCLGITGYDSDVAGDGIVESAAAWEGIKDVLAIYKDRLKYYNKRLAVDCDTLLENGLGYLRQHPGFNEFNRMEFIRHYADPLSGLIRDICTALKVDLSGTYTSVKYTANGLFDKEAFDVDFFTDHTHGSLTPEKVLLGKELFYDQSLSGNRQMSCASCHKPELAFTDGEVKSPVPGKGVVTKRNTPTLYNAGLQSALFYDLRVSYLEDQVTDVLSNKDEMHASATLAIERIKSNRHYVELFKNAFPDMEDPMTPYLLQNAIGSYMRSLISLDAPFDKYMRGDSTQMSREEVAGFNLYMGKARCGSCHFAPLFNGLIPPDFVRNESEVIGVPASPLQNKIDSDKGYFMVYAASPYLHAFKTPTLRNIALTAPYMHNGAYKTLEEVMEFYNKGGGVGEGIPITNQTLPVRKLNLSQSEQKEIIAFLKTLTDTTSNKLTKKSSK